MCSILNVQFITVFRLTRLQVIKQKLKMFFSFRSKFDFVSKPRRIRFLVCENVIVIFYNLFQHLFGFYLSLFFIMEFCVCFVCVFVCFLDCFVYVVIFLERHVAVPAFDFILGQTQSKTFPTLDLNRGQVPWEFQFGQNLRSAPPVVYKFSSLLTNVVVNSSAAVSEPTLSGVGFVFKKVLYMFVYSLKGRCL